MKKVKYLAMLLAAGMFAACSDNLEDTGAGMRVEILRALRRDM